MVIIFELFLSILVIICIPTNDRQKTVILIGLLILAIILIFFTVLSPQGLNENREIQINISETNPNSFIELSPTNVTDAEKKNLRFDWKTNKGSFVNSANFFVTSKAQGITFSNSGDKIFWTCCNDTNDATCSGMLYLKVTNTKTMKIISNTSKEIQRSCNSSNSASLNSGS